MSIVPDPTIAFILGVLLVSLSPHTYYLNKKRSEQDTHRDYECEALKGFTKNLNPFPLRWLKLQKLDSCTDLAKRANWKDKIMFNGEYFVKSPVCYLLQPCAVLRHITRRLTLVDLQVDSTIYSQHILAKAT